MKTVIFDLDGTMYRGTSIIPEAKVCLEQLQKAGIPFLFLTNNSMRTPQENRMHMEKMGYTGIENDQFYNSAMASAAWAKKHVEGNRAYFIGAKGMEQALKDEGFEITQDHPDMVFVGLDKEADYHAYSKALAFLLDGARLIGTNKDRILAKPGGFEVGNGSVVALFEYATGQKSPDIGKPSAVILDLMLEKYGLKKDEVILVGDNLETDIALGHNSKVETVFVESGVHTRKDLDRFDFRPDHIVTDLASANLAGLLSAQNIQSDIIETGNKKE